MKNLLLVILGILFTNLSFSQKIEVVFCADFSGSTNGMVPELQKTIWSTMNQLEAENSSVEISCGLVGYGRKAFGKENFYSEVIHPLGTPINDIGYTLVKLQVIINSCEAYPQKALNDCVKEINWSKEDAVRKIIVFIGNGGIPSSQMENEVKKAAKKGISIRPIYYKPTTTYNNGKQGWKNFAKASGCDFVEVESSKLNIKFKKYYDESFIASSGDKLTATYIPYKQEGRLKLKQYERMFEKLKETSHENYEEMLVYQGSKTVQGLNSSWDLVDMLMIGDLDVEKLQRNGLPVFMQGFTDDQILKYVKLKLRERNLIVNKLRLELTKRNEFANRKQEKSKYLQGKGGMSNVVSTILKSEVQQIQVFASN